MANFFKYAVDELHALPKIKKNFEDVSAKLISYEAKMSEVMAKVKMMIEERYKLNADNILVQQQLVAEKAEKFKETADARKVATYLELEKSDRLVKESDL
ncbi:hypothetical protein SESBI_44590 [Sesbania bispinosa]|nr:hypothetical protein SESBI_44590 [Sesbania bispinosa]